jgi:carboxypeptidase Taq
MTNYQKLTSRFGQISHLRDIQALASWDEAVMMPQGSGPYRNEALADLAVVIQNLTASPEIGDWLVGVQNESLDDWQMANVREMNRIYLENTVIPTDLNQKLTIAKMNCEQRWRDLRAHNNWREFLPHLEEVLKLTREMLACLSQKRRLSIYDTALSLYSPGLDTATVEGLFSQLKGFLPGLINEVLEKQARETTLLPEGMFPKEAQRALGLELMELIGFSTDTGRLDESHHPFCGGSSRDVRITTRYNEREFISSLMAVLHESGHAIYEQHLPESWLGQPVGQGCGMSIHESQSLFMEMQICRSKEFLTFVAPYIRKHMSPYVKNPDSLETENLIRLVTRVRKSLIRVEADEATYPAHIILRFEIERDLLENKWPLRELPEVWNEKMKSYLGLSTLGDDKNGCMQDVHWPSGAFGYFPAYTFGAVIAAQLFAKMEAQQPNLRRDIISGNFDFIRSWLLGNIWSQGSRMGTLELVKQAAGPLEVSSFRKHLDRRYLSDT